MEEQKEAGDTTKRQDFGTRLWDAVQQFRAENPGLDRYEAKFADCTKVVIKIPRQRR